MKNLQSKNFEQLSEAVRYYRWFADIVSPWVGKRVLDVGCGYGNVVANFLDRPYVRGIDIEPDYIEHVRKRFADRTNFRAGLGDVTDPETVRRLRNEHFDTAIAFNVLEHVKDDAGAARNLYDTLEPGGHCIMLVPAFQWLMSPYDAAVGHFRRYTKSSADVVLRDAGFAVVYARYFNALGALGWLWTYKLRKKDEPGDSAIKLLEFLIPALKRIESALPMPFGISVIVIGKKLP